jgi:hypothetical protein
VSRIIRSCTQLLFQIQPLAASESIGVTTTVMMPTARLTVILIVTCVCSFKLVVRTQNDSELLTPAFEVENLISESSDLPVPVAAADGPRHPPAHLTDVSNPEFRPLYLVEPADIRELRRDQSENVIAHAAERLRNLLATDRCMNYDQPERYGVVTSLTAQTIVQCMLSVPSVEFWSSMNGSDSLTRTISLNHSPSQMWTRFWSSQLQSQVELDPIFVTAYWLAFRLEATSNCHCGCGPASGPGQLTGEQRGVKDGLVQETFCGVSSFLS